LGFSSFAQSPTTPPITIELLEARCNELQSDYEVWRVCLSWLYIILVPEAGKTPPPAAPFPSASTAPVESPPGFGELPPPPSENPAEFADQVPQVVRSPATQSDFFELSGGDYQLVVMGRARRGRSAPPCDITATLVGLGTEASVFLAPTPGGLNVATDYPSGLQAGRYFIDVITSCPAWKVTLRRAR
jgi:hypothetical protein